MGWRCVVLYPLTKRLIEMIMGFHNQTNAPQDWGANHPSGSRQLYLNKMLVERDSSMSMLQSVQLEESPFMERFILDQPEKALKTACFTYCLVYVIISIDIPSIRTSNRESKPFSSLNPSRLIQSSKPE